MLQFIMRAGAMAFAGIATMWAFDPITDDSGIYVITWERGTIPIQNNLPGTPNFSDGTTFRSSMDVAIADWNAEVGNVQFASTHGSTGSYAVGNDINEFVLDGDIGGFDFGDSTLAVTVSFTDGGNTRVESDIIFNDRWEWDSYRGELRSAEDVRRVAIHELGHVLGLDHPDQASPPQSVTAVMNSVVSDTDGLREDDIAGGQFLYGAPNSPPPNDDFANATNVVLDSEGRASLAGSNVQSSSEADEPILDQGAPGGRSVWWKWTASANGVVEVSTVGSSFDTVLGVFSGSQVDGLTGLGVADDIEAGIVRTSRLSFLAIGGETYHFMVDGWDGLEGGIILGVQLLEAPKPIISLPERRIIAPLGESLTLTASAQPVVAGALSYQWRKDNQLLAGETGTSLVLNDVTNDDAGAYTLEVVESGGNTGYVTAFVLPKYVESSVSLWSRELIRDADPAPSEVSDVIAVEAGGTHALALREDGTVVGWIRENLSGVYDVGQETPPVGLGSVVAISAGFSHSIALKADGTVVTWGGRINAPAVDPSDLSNVVAISAGRDDSAALLADGSVVLWDYRYGVTTQNTLPRNVVAVEMLDDRGVTLHHDGQIKYWNVGFLEELNRPDLPEARSFSGGADTLLSLGFDGRVYQAATESGVRMQVPATVHDVNALEAGGVVAYGIKANGTITSWLDGEVGPNLFELLPEGLSNVVAFDVDDFGIALSTGEGVVPPTVIDVSADVSIIEGELLVISAKIGGSGPFSFQWKRDGVVLENDHRIAGAGTARLAIRDTNEFDTGNYTLEVTSAAGDTTSPEVSVDVAPKGSFVTVPLTQLAVEGDTVEFTAAFNGFGDVAYQWFHNESPLQDEEDVTLILPNVSLAQAGRYALRARDSRGSVWTQCELIVAASDAVAVTWDGNWAGIDYPAAPVPATAQPAAKVSIGEHGLVLLANGEVLNLRRDATTNTDLPADLSDVVDIAVGTEFAVALRADGSVTAWGKNNLGQADVPAGLGRVIAIEASHDYAMALCSDGNLISWGNPAVVDLIPTGRDDIVEFSAWSSRGVALHRDRSVSSWGNRQQPPDELTDVVKLSAGSSEAAALLANGMVQNWALGDVSGLPYDPFGGLEDMVAVDQGLSGGIAVSSDGTVTRWNYQGVVIDDVPQAVSNAVDAVVGGFFAAIIRTSIPVFTTTPAAIESMSGEALLLPLEWTGQGAPLVEWYRNGEAVELGSRISLDPDGSLRITDAVGEDSGTYRAVLTNAAGSATSPEFNVTVLTRPTLTGVLTNRHVAAGDEITLDATSPDEGVTYAWFRDGEMIAGQTAGILRFPQITRADAGRYEVVVASPGGGQQAYTVAVSVVDPDLTPRMWGGHPAGFDEVPVGVTDIVQFSSQTGHALALSRGGAVLSWGSNTKGQIELPRRFDEPVEVSAGSEFSMVLDSSGSVTVWGENRYGQATVPQNLPPIKEISAGGRFAAALTMEGEVYAWGLYYGAGDQPLDIPEAIGIEAGLSNSLLILLADGTVRDFYEGNDHTESRVPENLANVVQIAAASSSHLALTADGSLTQWSFGSEALSPPPDGLTDISEISASGGNALALKPDGSVVAWASGSLGEDGVPSDLPLAQSVQAANRAGFALVPFSSDRLAISGQPQSVWGDFGSALSFNVVARAGSGSLSYQWLRDGEPIQDVGDISGAQSSELSIGFASAILNGVYTVEVSDAQETVTSLPVSLSVEVSGASPVFASHPLSQRVQEGDDITLSAQVDGAVRYEWRHFHRPIPGAHEPSLSLSEVQLSDGGVYQLFAVGEGGQIAVSVLHLNVMPRNTELLAWTLPADDSLLVPDDIGELGSIHAGAQQAFVLRPDGTVKGWGSNSGGAIEASSSLADVVDFHVLLGDYAAVTSDGRPLTSNADWNLELEALAIDDAVAAIASNGHALFLRADGSIVGVGSDVVGESTAPDDLGPAIDIAAAGSGSLALLRDGSIRFWGSSSGGVDGGIPPGDGEIMRMGLGFGYGIIQLADGTVELWGHASGRPEVPEEIGYVADFDASIYDLGIIDELGSAAIYNANGMSVSLDGWTNMRQISVGRDIHLGLQSSVRPTINAITPDVVVSPGEQAILIVDATGTGSLSYQWSLAGEDLIDGEGIAGAQTSILTIDPVGVEDLGSYTVTIIDGEGTTISDPVLLQFDIPVITRQPKHQATFGGQSTTLDVEVMSTGSVSYQWYRGDSGATGLPIVGATDPELTLSDEASTGRVWVRVSNENGSFDSETTHLLSFGANGTGVATGSLHVAGFSNGRYFVLGSQQGASSTDLTIWQGIDASSVGHTDVVYGHGVYVCGGGSTVNGIYISQDGENWGNANGYASGNIIRDLAFNGSRFVAVSDVAGYSDDGTNWTAGEVFSAESVVWGGDRFVAVGSGVVRVSMDGVTWEEGTAPPGPVGFREVTYGQGVFVATSIGVGGAKIWYSNDGYNWEPSAAPVEGDLYGSIIRLAYGNGVFAGVPVGSRRSNFPAIYLSADGRRWHASNAGFSKGTSITFGDGRFAVTDFDGVVHGSVAPPGQIEILEINSPGTVVPGTDFEISIVVNDPTAIIQWFEGSNGDTTSPIPGGTDATLSLSIEETTDYWVRVTGAGSAVDSSTLMLIAAEAPVLVVAPQHVEALQGDEVELQAEFTAVPTPEYQWFKGATGDTSQPVNGGGSPSLTVEVTEGHNAYWVRATNLAGSADSESVTVVSWNQLNNWGDLRVFGELDGELTGIAYTGVLRSPRGVSWRFDQPAGFPNIRAVARGSGRYVALTQYGSGLSFSDDLLIWTELSLPAGFGSGDLFDVVYAWGAFWVATNKSGQVLHSTDGLTWAAMSLGSAATDVSLSAWYFDGQRLVGVGGDAVSQTAAIFYSLDGENWQRADLSGQVSSGQSFQPLESIDQAHGRLYAWDNIRGVMLTSLDGETWLRLDRATAGLNQIRPVGFGELGRYAVTADAGTMRVSLDGLNWTAISSHEAFGLRPHGLISLPGRLLVEGDGGIWETTDLVNWTLRTRHPSRSNSFRDVVVGDGIYVTSVFRDGDSFSSDGKIWPAMVDPITPSGVGGVLAYGDGLFLASDPEGGGAYWYSSNGSDWTAANIADFGNAINELIYLNEQWFALGIDGLFAHSPDGVNWTLGSVTGATGFHYALAFGNDRYVLSAGRDIWWSSDLLSWTAGPTLSVPGLALTFGQERFVVVGGANDGQILTSSDGEEWTQRFVMGNNGMYDVTNDGDRFYAATAEGILVSEDALSWRWSRLPAATSVMADGENVVAAGGTVLVRANPQPRPVSFRQELIAGPASEGRILGIVADVSGDYASLQWVFNGQPMVDGPRISGATTQSLLVDPITQDDAGEYELIVTDLSGETISQSVSVVVTRTPQIVTQPLGASLAPGEALSLTVSATGGGLRYQWFLNGSAIAGASNASLEVLSATFADGGRYEVLVFNSSGEVLSESAFVSVLPSGVSLTGNQILQSERFVPGGEVVIANHLDWSGEITGLTVSVLLPEGWALIDTDADSADVVPDPGDELLLEWTWNQPSSSPLEFSYRLAVPADSRAPVGIEAVVSIGLGPETSWVLLSPDPLVVRPALHSADTDGDSRLGLSELLRVIELYNTRSGTSRTGRYGLSETSEDSFMPDNRPVDEGNGPTRFHSADVNRDGRLGLSELLRVIELYNTRSGTSRTGAYRIDTTTTDGFAPDA